MEKYIAQLLEELEKLKQETADNPEQQAAVEKMQAGFGKL